MEKRMILEEFGEYRIFRPSYENEFQFRVRLENFVRSQYEVGRYTDPKKINEILNTILSHLDDELKTIVKKLAHRSFIEFFLGQYDQSCKIRTVFEKLSLQKQSRWEKIGPIFRRAVKYIAELATIYQLEGDIVNDYPKGEECLYLTEDCLICAEQVFSYTNNSDSTFYLFPQETVLEIFPPGDIVYISVTTGNGYQEDMKKRVDFHRNNYDTTYELRKIPSYDIGLQEKYLNPCFGKEFGVTYSNCLACIREIIDCAKPAPDTFVPFYQKEMIINELHKISSIPKEKIEFILSGFSLSKNTLQTRVPYKPKQEHRASFRAFFEYSWDTGAHLVWSPEMAKEAYIALCHNIAFSKPPTEWMNNNVEKALSSLNNAVGKWFEDAVASHFSKMGIVERRGIKSIGTGTYRLSVPSDGVGEIDFIGYLPNEKMLIIAECKMVQEGTDPVFWRDSISEFVTSKKSYMKKFSKKISWIVNNYGCVKKALDSEVDFADNMDIEKIATVMITFAPSFAKYYIYDFPCVSLTEFIYAFREKGLYPYSDGLYSIIDGKPQKIIYEKEKGPRRGQVD